MFLMHLTDWLTEKTNIRKQAKLCWTLQQWPSFYYYNNKKTAEKNTTYNALLYLCIFSKTRTNHLRSYKEPVEFSYQKLSEANNQQVIQSQLRGTVQIIPVYFTVLVSLFKYIQTYGLYRRSVVIKHVLRYLTRPPIILRSFH